MDTTRNLKKLLRALTTFQELEPDIFAQAISTFLIIASAPSGRLPLKEVSEQLNMAQSTASRNVANLSKVDRHKMPGLGLVGLELDPTDYRKKIVSLTPKGHKLAQHMSTLLD